MRGRAAVAFVLLGLVAACTSQAAWVNPSLPQERMGSDLAACRRTADRDLGPSAYVAPGDERSGNPMKLAEQSENVRQFDQMVASCMRSKGYRPVK